MIKIEKYFEELYEYVELWASGYVKAYSPEAQGEFFTRIKNRLIEALIDRFDVINRLRVAIGLDVMSVDDVYNYYINNMPDYDENRKVVDLYNYDQKTRDLASKEQAFSKCANAQAYLLVMGAPDIIIDNSDIIQTRLDHVNRLMLEGGFEKITPQKTEEIIEELFMNNAM
jgi:hypothetical protein